MQSDGGRCDAWRHRRCLRTALCESRFGSNGREAGEGAEAFVDGRGTRMSELLTIEEVATILNVSPDTVTRRFAKVKGVVDLGSPETPKRRRYRVLRIPKSVVEKYLLARGGPVEVKAPNRPQKVS